MKLRAISFLSAAAVAWMLTLPGIANAVPVFKYDTTYKLSGEFNFGVFGKLKLSADSILYYDSTTDQLTIDASATSNKYKGGTLNLDYLLGDADPKNGAVEVGDLVQFNKKNGKVEFDYDPDGMKKNGMRQVGVFSSDFDIKKLRVDANQQFVVLAQGMKPFLTLDNKNRLYFQSWISFWGHGWDVHADPKFYLTEIPNIPPPSNEIPEPFTMGLLATGLLGGAAVRRRSRQ